MMRYEPGILLKMTQSTNTPVQRLFGYWKLRRGLRRRANR
jgi:hypothetical protein